MKPKKHLKRSPLVLKILSINILTLIVFIAGVYFFAPYRKGLVLQEQKALTRQANIFAGAIGEGSVQLLNNGNELIHIPTAIGIIQRLSQQDKTVRAQLFLGKDLLAYDSGKRARAIITVTNLPPPNSFSSFIALFKKKGQNFFRHLDGQSRLPLAPSLNQKYLPSLKIIKEAISGHAGQVVMRNKKDQLVFLTAVPVQRYYRVMGILILERTGQSLEHDLTKIRLVMLGIFLAVFVLMLFLSLYLSWSIARPLRKLSYYAQHVQTQSGTVQHFARIANRLDLPNLGNRGDEIGDLSIALHHMVEALQKRIRDIEQFAADVAHELKNPLASIRSAMESFTYAKTDEQKKRLLDIVFQDVDRMSLLITDVSNASRLDAELLRVKWQPIDLSYLITTLKDLYTTNKLLEDIQLTASIKTKKTYFVEGDEERLVQVLRNLISNASSHSPKDGHINITLSHEKNGLILEVNDEGPGIPPENLTRIFKRFYTDRPQDKYFGHHSGLGLSICKQIIEAHNGDIRALNRYNDKNEIIGACFRIHLPTLKSPIPRR